MRIQLAFAAMTFALLTSGCGNSVRDAVSIGKDTYIMTTQAKPSPFGVASSANMGNLIEEASATCTEKGLKFVLVSQEQVPGNAFKLGNGSVTFKCEN